MTVPAVWLRHPRVAVAPGLCYGRLDVALGPTADVEIAEALAATPRVSAVWRSPAGRCAALAEALAERDGVAVVVDPRLHELDFGTWEGRPWDEIDRAESDPWAADPRCLAPPGGERFDDLIARVAGLLEETDLPCDAGVVAHAGVIRAARMLLAGDSFETVFAAAVPYARPIDLKDVAPWLT
ncbi:MAG: histidine phosphatase family protein [Pseudomonadota bacterium]